MIQHLLLLILLKNLLQGKRINNNANESDNVITKINKADNARRAQASEQSFAQKAYTAMRSVGSFFSSWMK